MANKKKAVKSMNLGFMEPQFPAKAKGKGTGAKKKKKMGFKPAF